VLVLAGKTHEIVGRVEEPGLDLGDRAVRRQVRPVGLDVGRLRRGQVPRGPERRQRVVVLAQLEADLAERVGLVPLQLAAGRAARAPRGGQDAFAAAQAARLGVGRVEAVQLLLELAQLVLQVQEQAVVERLEAPVDGLDGVRLMMCGRGHACALGAAASVGVAWVAG
jgi:hypothetical protein